MSSGSRSRTWPATPPCTDSGTRSFAWPRVNSTASPATSWPWTELSAASVSGRNGSLVSSRVTPAETRFRIPVSTVSRNCWSRSGSAVTASSTASCTACWDITVSVTRVLIRDSTSGRSTIV